MTNMLSTISFAHPYCLLLLLLLVPCFLWRFLLKRRTEATLVVASTEAFRRREQTLRTALIHAPFLLRMLTLALVIVVLARPQTKHALSEKETEGINIMMVMDISVSMLTPDLQPNRLEAAKQVAYEFIQNRPNDNIGLTLFGGEAFTQCPMTTDHASLLSMFRSVSCSLQQQGIISDGTAIGMGITNAVARLAQDSIGSKVIILLTDGANNAGDISPLMAAEIAKKSNVRVYTIAVGTDGVVNQPVAVLPDGSYYYQKVKADMDTGTLQEIARMTGGLFYHAQTKGKLRDIYNDIDKLEKTKLRVKNFDKRYEAYQPFALAAFVSLLLEMLLRTTLLRRIP